MGYSPDVETGWTAPVESGFSVQDNQEKTVENASQEGDPSQGYASDEFVPDAGHSFEDEFGRQDDHASTRRKKKNPFQKRIDQLVYEKGAIEQSNSFLAQQLAEKEAYLAQQQARLSEYENQIQQKDHQTNEYFESSLESHEHSIKDKIRQAKENGDIDAEIELIDQLAEAKSTRTAHEAWKIQERARKQQQAYDEPYEPLETHIQAPYQTQSPQDMEFREWASENQWYANPKLRSEADSIADELANILTFNNQAHLIGTSDFRETVTNEMRTRYGIGQKNHAPEPTYEEEESYNPYPSRAPVAPVTRRGGSTMAQDYANNRGGTRVGQALNKEEYELARYLPVRNNKEGEMDLVKRYQKAKAYPKSPMPGGSPYRLTIL